MTDTSELEDSMTFYTFMMKNHRMEQTPSGDLARDMYEDKEHFPRNGTGKFDGWHRILRIYLVRHNTCRECLAVLEECWKDYVVCEKSRLSRSW